MTRATRSPRRAILHPGICWTRVEEEPALEMRLREAAWRRNSTQQWQRQDTSCSTVLSCGGCYFPKPSASRSRESESISSVSSVFYPNCLDPGGSITVPTGDLPHSWAFQFSGLFILGDYLLHSLQPSTPFPKVHLQFCCWPRLLCSPPESRKWPYALWFPLLIRSCSSFSWTPYNQWSLCFFSDPYPFT